MATVEGTAEPTMPPSPFRQTLLLLCAAVFVGWMLVAGVVDTSRIAALRSPAAVDAADDSAAALAGPCEPILPAAASRVFFPVLAVRLKEYAEGLRRGAETLPHPLQSTIRYVEIGCRRCQFTWETLTMFKTLAPQATIEAYCVDSWGHRPDPEPGAPDENDDRTGKENKRHCENTIGKFKGVTLKQTLSVNGAALFPDNYFDIVYIDALHTEDAAFADMMAWWPKLRPGGLFSGDDFGDRRHGFIEPWFGGGYRAFQWGVTTAAARFQEMYPIHVYATHQNPKFVRDHLRHKSPQPVDWYAVKPNATWANCRVPIVDATRDTTRATAFGRPQGLDGTAAPVSEADWNIGYKLRG